MCYLSQSLLHIAGGVWTQVDKKKRRNLGLSRVLSTHFQLRALEIPSELTLERELIQTHMAHKPGQAQRKGNNVLS